MAVEKTIKAFSSLRRKNPEKENLGKEKVVERFAKKGQMFLLTSIIVVLGLVSLSNLLGIYKTVEETRMQESLILDKQLKNIKGEYEMIAAAARLNNDVNGSAIRYLSNFSELLRNTADTEILYSFVFYNGTNKNYSVTIGNYLKDSINATINVSNSTAVGAFIGVIDDKKNETRTFEAGMASGTVTVNITYSIKNENVTETIPVTVSSMHYASLFYDIKLAEGGDFVRVKDVYNITW